MSGEEETFDIDLYGDGPDGVEQPTYVVGNARSIPAGNSAVTDNTNENGAGTPQTTISEP